MSSQQWRDRAKCAGLPTDDFYPPRDREKYRPIADKSRAVCRGRDGHPECESRWECLLAAIESKERHGIWGGMSGRERNATVRRWEREYRGYGLLADFILDGAPTDWS